MFARPSLALARPLGGALDAAVIGAAAASALYLGYALAGPIGAAVTLLALMVALALVFVVAPRAAAAPPAAGDADPPSSAALAISQITAEVGIGFGIVEKSGSLSHANAPLLGLLGTDCSAFGAPLADCFISSDQVALRQALAEVLAGEVPLRELRLRTRAKPDEGVLATIGYIQRFDRLFITTKDDSYQLRLEAQMRQATKMEAVGQLAGGIAHDFNNILTAIIGACDLMLMRHGPGTGDHQDLTQIQQNANRAADLVRQLLAFSRQQTLKARLIKLPDVIGELSHLLRRLIGEPVRLRVTHGPGLAPVRADPGQLEQVIVNLAVNARDAMPEGGELTITTYSVAAAEVPALGHKVMPIDDYVAIAVRDTGLGIPADVMLNIFDPFFTTKAVGKGTGLGLSMVYGIVKQTGGFIFADSAPGLGTTFNIYLPAATDEVVEVPAAPVPAAPTDWGHGAILLVEDEAMVRAVASRALTRSGYDVVTAANGEEALAILETRGAFDLLISDVVMPGMDGPALVAKARERWPELRVLFISGYAEEQLRGRVDDVANTLLRKPFSIHELGAAVRARLAA